jgi:hypothetical protein
MRVEIQTEIVLPRLRECYQKTKKIPRSYRTNPEDLQNIGDVQANLFALVKYVESCERDKVKECEEIVKEYDAPVADEDIFREASDVKEEMAK